LDILLSAWILDELIRTLEKPYFTSQLTTHEISLYLTFVRSRCEFVPLDFVAVPRIATQREDDFVIATAVVGRASYLVTGDRMVRGLDAHQDILFVTPREFQDVIDSVRDGELS
jgi:predicted nucleic acid-binding protein